MVRRRAGVIARDRHAPRREKIVQTRASRARCDVDVLIRNFVSPVPPLRDESLIICVSGNVTTGARPELAPALSRTSRAAMAGRIPSTMRAAVVRAFGGPEVVRVAKDVPVPRLAPDEILVRVAAASVSPLDARVRAGYARALYAPMLPLILGRDVSGEVVARGADARSFQLGAQVFGALSPVAPRGAHAEFVAVREAHVAPKPSAWTHAQAAAVPFAALTAWRALFTDAGLKENERLLVHGLGSTVGGFAAQLARARGAATAGSVGARSRRRVAETATIADENLWTYDENSNSNSNANDRKNARDDVPLRSLAAASAHHRWEPFDVALDLVGDGEKRLARLLRRGRGRLVTAHGDLARLVGEKGVVRGAALAAAELARKKVLFRVNEDVSYMWTVMRQDAEAMRRIGEHAEAGKLTPPPVVAARLADAADAHRAAEAGETPGKIILEP